MYVQGAVLLSLAVTILYHSLDLIKFDLESIFRFRDHTSKYLYGLVQDIYSITAQCYNSATIFDTVGLSSRPLKV